VFIETKDAGGGGNNWTTGAKSCAKLQSNNHQQSNMIREYKHDCSSVYLDVNIAV